MANKNLNSITCVVNGCPGKNIPTIRLYKFPDNNPELLAKWCGNIGMPQTQLRYKSKICSRHFEPSCIGSKKIRFGATPTLFFDGNNDRKIELSVLTAKGKKNKIRTCIVNGCGSNSVLTSIYSFPKDEQRRQAWIEECNITEESKRIKHLNICGKHFDQDFVRPTSLNKKAFPIFYNDKYKNTDIVYDNDVVYEPDVFKGSVAFKDPESDYDNESNDAKNFSETVNDSNISYEFDIVIASDVDNNSLTENVSDNDGKAEIYNKFVAGNECYYANDSCDNNSYVGSNTIDFDNKHIGFDNMNNKLKVCNQCRKNRKLALDFKKRLINVQKDLKKLKLIIKRLNISKRIKRMYLK